MNIQKYGCYSLFDDWIQLYEIILRLGGYNLMYSLQPSQFDNIMQQLSNKLQAIHKQIRKEQISSLMKKARYEMQRLTQETVLNEIVNMESIHLTARHIQILAEMINKDVTNAIIHLGNLVIDRYITIDILQDIQWKVGNNDKWTWLIDVFSEIGFCTGDMYHYCIKKIITKYSNFNLEHALGVLQKSFKQNQEALFLFKREQLLLALSNHIYDQSDKIVELVLIVFSTVTSQDEKMPQFIINTLGEVRLTQMLLHCFMKVNNTPRILACQIANNFLMSKIDLESVRLRIFELASGQKEKVKIEISYYLKAFAENAPQNLILRSIKKSKLLQILQRYSKICSPNPKYDRQISQNAVKSLSTIFQRFNNSTERIIEGQRQLMESVQKMIYQSESQTIYEQQSYLLRE